MPADTDDNGAITEHRFLNPSELIAGVGFSHVALPVAGQLVLVAGQTAHDGDGRVQGLTMAQQTDGALRNLVTALAAAGARPQHLVSLQIYVTDVAAYREHLSDIGAAWRRHLGKHFPAVSLFMVAGLYDPDAMIEIVATAVIPEA